MHKSLLVIVLWLFACIGAQAQKSVVTVERDDFSQLQVRFDLGALESSKAQIQGTSFTTLAIDGCMPSAKVGAPSLPTFSNLVEVPLCDDFSVEFHGEQFDTIMLAGPQVMPLQPSRSKSDNSRKLVIDRKLYTTDALYSETPVIIEEVGIARDRRLARLQFSPVSYNPVTGMLTVCRKATVTIHYQGVHEAETHELFARYNSPAFASGAMSLNNLYKAVNTSAPVRYLIVAHSSFRGQMDSFVQWKRRKGFITDIVYTGDAGVGTTNTAIAQYIKSQYTNATAASPAPTYVLIVGDHEQIPAFDAQVTSPSSDHITDLYYFTWTSGDIIPDCYYGRFSAQTVAQLTPQIEKTLMYEQYTFADPSFLDRAVMVAGVDGGSSGDYGYTHADPAMDYAVTNYVNGAHGFSQVKYFKNNTSIVPSGVTNVTIGSSSSSNSATVRTCYNDGAGWINYSAHGSATSWGTPNFTTSHAAAMTNSQKFGIMIGNCCLTNKFETTTCLGEAVLRKGDYCGAVGYIGGSNSTYWNEDFYWAVGLRSGIGPSMSMSYSSGNLGGYDRIFHTHNESHSAWVKTQGELMYQGNMAVQGSTSGYKDYYWEIYHLMGDPSLMPYLTQAPAMTLSASSVVMLGATTLSVTAAPYAYVALTDTLTHTLKASGYANASGQINLTLPSSMAVGGYEIAASAQQYRTAFRSVSVVPSSGPYPVVVSVTPTTTLKAGSSAQLRIAVANLGTSNASGVSVTLTSDNSLVTLSSGTLNVGSIAAGDTVYLTSVTATASSQAADATVANVTAATHWSGSSSQASYNAALTVAAPVVTMTVTPSATSLLPGSSITVAVSLANSGHATLGTSQLTVTTGNPQLTVSSTGGSFTLTQGSTLNRQFTLTALAAIDSDIFVPVYLHLSGAQTINDTLLLYIGVNSTETFEGGIYHVDGWTQGSFPWTLTSEESYEGSWSARSTENLGNSNTSEMSISFTSARADSVSFYYKVSSEANYDKFHCYLDGTEMVVASGEVDWTRAAFAVSAGSHLLTFDYAKDVSLDRNSDCAWVDYVCLPHGSQSGGGSGGDDGGDDEPGQGTFENLVATFESPDDDSRWTIANGTLCNGWHIGTAAANGSSRGLYISNDNGQTNAYTVNCSTSVFVYTTLWLDNGDYTAAFDWRCNGESSYDYLRAALLPASITPVSTAEQASGWTISALPSGAIALDGGQKLNQSTSWQTQVSEVNITQSGWYRLVFYWRNDYSIGYMPPAAIDNVLLIRAGGLHTVTATATHGTTTGSGNYTTGDVATIGVYPEAGYTFSGWSDGNTNNPRQLIVDNDITITANLTQGTVVTLHDTTIVQVPYAVHYTTVIEVPYAVHDTTVVEVPYAVHDTTVVEVPYAVHDTTVVTLTDTVTLTEYVTMHDTTVVEVPYAVHDTTVVTLTDTVAVTEYVTMHDTTVVEVPYAVHDTTVVTITDTVTLTEYVTLQDTVYVEGIVHDTTVVQVPYPVHDTTVVTLTDTVTLTEYVTLHDTTFVDVPYPVHDTTVVTLTDTVTLTEYVTMHDTTFVDVPYPVHDTTVVTLTDTVTLTEYVTLHDTTFVDVPYPVHDTTVVTLIDTVTLTEYVTLHDTTFIDVPYPVHDTTVVTLIDTVTLTEYVTLHDTTFVDVPYPVHDTTIVTLTDTVTLTEYVTLHDTVDNFIHDTTLVTDTLWLTLHDTVWLTDTIIIHDTIYITVDGIDDVETLNAKVYVSQGQIVVEGADGNNVVLYDVTGRVLASRRDSHAPLRFDAPASGSYLIRIGNRPPRRIVVVR